MRKTEYPNPTIADRIQEVFFRYNLTDRQVAKKLGIERKTISSYRNCYSNPSIKFVRWLCSNYNVSPEWLLDLEGGKHEM